MTTPVTRREFLASTAAIGITATLPGPLARGQGAPMALTVARRSLDVDGKAASVFGVTAAAGSAGLTLGPDQRFSVALRNEAGEDSIVHWHGQTPPVQMDGVTETGYAQPVSHGAQQAYDFTPRSGTHWLHSHHGLQQQALLAAPLVVRSADDLKADRQEVVVLLQDFSFRQPDEILASLGAMTMHGMPAMPGHSMPGMSGMDLNDVDYDAYLANDRPLGDPQVVRTQRNGAVLLRIINAAAPT